MDYILTIIRWRGELRCFGRVTALRMLLEKTQATTTNSRNRADRRNGNDTD